MREPFETLLVGLKDHRFLADYLNGRDVPDWGGLALEPRFESLSTGEVILLDIGLALWNGDPSARIADIAKLDAVNRYRVICALYLAYGS